MITKVTLIVIVIMAGDLHDKRSSIEMPTKEACLAAASEWLDSKLPPIDGAVGLAASCAVEMEGDDP